MNILKQKHFNLLNKAFKKVLSSGWFILGNEVENFERKFAQYLGAKYCVGVGNGLEALQISLMALGVGQDDEVITTPISAAATVLAIIAVGAKPVFVDTDLNGIINVELIEDAITKKTKAILPVHLYGNSADLIKIQKLCKKYRLFLIEDAAQAHGSLFNGRKLGTFGTLGCFSFYPTKNLGALGDGGAIVTNNNRLTKICGEIRDYGQRGKYNHIRFGLNSRLDELQAALLSVKLNFLESDNMRRRLIAKRYIKNLKDMSNIRIVTPNNKITPNFHQFVVLTSKRTALQKYLKKFNIPSAIHYPKILPYQFFLKKFRFNNLPKASVFVSQCLSLPMDTSLTLKKVDFISSKITKFLKK